MSSTTFILASSPSTSTLPPAPQLHILPFSLGSNSNPYSTSSATTSQYFQPRSAPSNLPSIPTGALISTFRGRTLVGHTLSVPRGYKGVILGTSKRPDQGGLEHRNHTVDQKGKGKAVNVEKWPLTPASSVGSVASVPESNHARVTRQNTRGQGQVARARTQARQPPRKAVAKKRYRLDSDDEDSDGGVKVEAVEEVKTPMRTPSKRLRKGDVISPVKDPRLPAIVVQAPTPLKAKPITMAETDLDDKAEDEVGKKTEAEAGGGAQGSGERRQEEGVVIGPEVSLEESEMITRKAGQEEEGFSEVDVDEKLELDLDVQDIKEDIVPSPSTEEDPPAFDIPLVSVARDEGEEGEQLSEVDGSTRTLRPVSTFDHIMLWTPDGPLPGFRADELEENGDADGSENVEKVQKGWWRTGGAGEGGDEVVRAMGEWLGLVDMLNRPVYLDGAAEDEGDDEDDD